MTPLITVTPRLEQEFRYDQYDQKNGTGGQGNGQRLISYGGPRGAQVELIPSYDWEVILAPPPYVTASGPKGTAADLAIGRRSWSNTVLPTATQNTATIS